MFWKVCLDLSSWALLPHSFFLFSISWFTAKLWAKLFVEPYLTSCFLMLYLLHWYFEWWLLLLYLYTLLQKYNHLLILDVIFWKALSYERVSKNFTLIANKLSCFKITNFAFKHQKVAIHVLHGVMTAIEDDSNSAEV